MSGFLSIVIPVYNEAESIPLLYQEISEALQSLTYAYEVLFVDDGSTDESALRIRELCEKDGHVKGIFLKRNFGQTAALAAGFDHAQGEWVVTLDSDRQNDPGDIPKLLQVLREEGCDVVSGWRKSRQDPFWSRRFPSHIANWLISKLTRVPLHDYGCTLKVYQKEVVKNVKLYGEMHRFIPALAAWQGAVVREVEVNHRPRTKGKSKYGIFRTFKVLLDLMTVLFMSGFSTKPIYFFGIFGALTMLLSLGTMSVLIYMKLATGISMIQSPLLHLSALLFSLGIQFVLLGLLAEINVRTYYESQGKTIYRIKETQNVHSPR